MVRITRRTLLQATTLAGMSKLVPSAFTPSGRKVLFVDLDDLGWDYLSVQMAAGGAPNLSSAMAVGRRYPKFWAAPNCSVFRARAMTGLDAYRPGNLVGRIVGAAYDDFAGPSGQWICEGLPGSKVKLGKVHIAGANAFPGVMCARGWDCFMGMQGNLGHAGGSYYSWIEEWADANGTGSQVQTQHNTTRLASLAINEIAAGTDLVHVSFNAIHSPLELPPNNEPAGKVYSGSTDDEIRAAMLFHLDHWVGEVVSRALSAGYVVLIVCDNGTDGEGKGTYTEDGVRTPLVILGAGVASGESRRLVQATDLWATVRRMRGDMSGATAADSVDFTDDVLGWTPVAAPRQFLTCDWFPFVGIAPPADKWSRIIRDNRWKLVDQKLKPSGVIADVVLALFDLASDPTEQTNLLDAPLSPEAQAAYDLLWANLP